MYVARFTDKEVIPYDGFCPTHHLIDVGSIERAKKEHPNAKVVVHPECLPDVIDLADHVCSTSGMYKYVGESDAEEFIIGTEVGILYRMRKNNPAKTFHPCNKYILCPNMKMTTLDSLAQSLRHIQYVVEVPEEISRRAKQALDRMLEIS
jgi:quinolinate synthase